MRRVELLVLPSTARYSSQPCPLGRSARPDRSTVPAPSVMRRVASRGRHRQKTAIAGRCVRHRRRETRAALRNSAASISPAVAPRRHGQQGLGPFDPVRRQTRLAPLSIPRPGRRAGVPAGPAGAAARWPWTPGVHAGDALALAQRYGVEVKGNGRASAGAAVPPHRRTGGDVRPF